MCKSEGEKCFSLLSQFVGDFAMATKGHLRKFFAVTITSSVYQASIGGRSTRKRPVPFLEKIALRGNSAGAVGDITSNGTVIAVSKDLQLFVPEGSGTGWSTEQRQIGLVNTRFHGGHTSAIVALFLRKEGAMACSREQSLQPCDSRWRAQTIAVIRAIGTEHPYCSISTSDARWWLMPPSEWQQ